MQNFLVVVESAGTNYSAYSPDVPGCVSTGPTIEATLANMREALAAHIELMAADGDPLPEARGLEHHLHEEPSLKNNPDLVFAHVAIDARAPVGV